MTIICSSYHRGDESKSKRNCTGATSRQELHLVGNYFYHLRHHHSHHPHHRHYHLFYWGEIIIFNVSKSLSNVSRHLSNVSDICQIFPTAFLCPDFQACFHLIITSVEYLCNVLQDLLCKGGWGKFCASTISVQVTSKTHIVYSFFLVL